MEPPKENSTIHTNIGTPTDSSFTGSPDSTDYTSDEYLRLPDKITSQSLYTPPAKVRFSIYQRNRFFKHKKSTMFLTSSLVIIFK